MSSRWHMNRIGFVNFWFYDEEVFQFSEGKLLLRGQNGSGKSITTQSFIPFILDGDRTPSRLDPFGSSDRKMDYYFLGEGERDDATGYLFLEFRRENTNQYRTIGIGQRAQSGKPMGFWGFMLIDGKRIGEDFQLYRQVGQKKIPLSKLELKNALGENNFFAETRKDYMALVNRHIFGFPKLEQYDQFIRLLIKVRAPKLSKEFKPTKVYEILNDSLQTLTDDDLRAMVDAMETMDDIQNKLDNLKEARRDVRFIEKEYQRYNAYMLGQKAQACLNAKAEANAQRQKYEEQNQEQCEKIAEAEEKTLENQRMNARIEQLEQEKRTLDITDIETSVEELGRNREKCAASEKEKARLEESIEGYRSNLQGYTDKMQEARKDADYLEQQADKLLREMTEYGRALAFSEQEKAEKLKLSRDLNAECRSIRQAAKELEQAVKRGLEALRALESIKNEYSQAQEYLQQLSQIKDHCAEALKDAERLEDACRDEIIEAYYHLARSFEELTLNHKTLNSISVQLQRYRGAGDRDNIQRLVQQVYDTRGGVLKDAIRRKENERDRTNSAYRECCEALKNLMAMREPVPERRAKVEEARRVLKAENIRCMPFYETIEFAPAVDEERQALLEEQLRDAGLLDALVIAPKDRSRAKAALKSLSDIVLNAEAFGKSDDSRLAAAELAADFREETEKILSNIYKADTAEALFVLAEDGYFKNGILEGHSVPEEPVSYVGAAARKRKKERLIADKQAEVNALEEKIDALNEKIKSLRTRLEQLQKEYRTLPEFSDLDQSIFLTAEVRRELDRAAEEAEKQEEVLTEIGRRKKDCDQQVIINCRPLPYTRVIEVYEEAEASAAEYIEDLSELEITLTQYRSAQSEYSHAQELFEKEESSMEEANLQLRRACDDIDSCKICITRLEEFLNNPENREKARRLEKVMGELDEKNECIRENNTRISVLESQIQGLAVQIKETEALKTQCTEAEARLSQYFEEELALGLVIPDEDQSLEDCARKAVRQLDENDRKRSREEITAALFQAYQKHGSNLSSSYGMSLEDCFEDEAQDLRKRQRIATVWDGKKLYLADFVNLLKDAIDSTELLIQEKDRELFENILADTLSRKLSRRITESRKWIKDMSTLMSKMETSMALSFSLDWKSKNAEGDNELDTKELEKFLRMDKELLKDEDIERVAAHFRSKIRIAKQMAEENKEPVNYIDLVRDALDYRRWFEFKMHYYRDGAGRKELTNGAFNRFSGGEKAMAMYVPLFAAVNAQYKKSDYPDHPRMIALDEAFAGVDEMNISSMFELVQKLEFDYIMNSQSLWGCYATVPTLRIAELLRPGNASVVTVINYQWNGHEKKLM